MRNIQIDMTKQQGPLCKAFNHCVSASRAYLLLRADHQQHLKMVVEECGFRYLRFHGLLQDDMGIYREDQYGNPIYSWQYVDEVYDFLLDIGIKPFVVFDFMPETLASGSKTIYWEKSNITPPKDYEKWGSMIETIVRHFTNRYGEDEVKTWFFEVWNEPDNQDYFFDGDFQEYCKLYAVTARAVKKVCGEYRVGGPASAGVNEWIPDLIDFCCENTVPMDFISTHTYSLKGYDESRFGRSSDVPRPMWEPGTPWLLGNLCVDPGLAIISVDTALQRRQSSKMTELDIYFTEWGLTYDYWDPLHDAYQAPSLMLTVLKESMEKVKCMSFCEVSDVFEEDGPPTDHFHGGFGLVNVQGIRKPSYFAYKFLNMLEGSRLMCDDTYTIACGQQNGAQILFWDSTFRQDNENKQYFNRDVQPLEAEPAEVTISGLKPGTYILELYCVGYRKNDAYTAFLDIKKDDSLSRAQVEALRNKADGSPELQETVTIGQDGTFTYTIPMRENDVVLLTLKERG